MRPDVVSRVREHRKRCRACTDDAPCWEAVGILKGASGVTAVPAVVTAASVRVALERHQATCPTCRSTWFLRLCPEGRLLADAWWDAKQAGAPGAEIDSETLMDTWRGVPPVADEYPGGPGK